MATHTNETKFSSLPFVKEYLQNQIEAGGGVVYSHFEVIPKNKYKQCKLIAARPCSTAKYVQCLAANITVSNSHILVNGISSYTVIIILLIERYS